MGRAWTDPQTGGMILAAKGAPEAIAELCHFGPAEYETVTQAVQEMAAQGLRVLGIARCTSAEAALPNALHEAHFEFVGLVGLADPLRADVPGAVELCHRAGIRVVMITGDYPATAITISRQAGIRNPERLMTGAELERLSPEELHERIGPVQVFARVMPEQKLRIVEGLKASGEIVAMTGDGVNDAPALKAAHIGIAMGKRGTDVAREAAALILLDDRFASIVDAIRLGRRIYDNIRKAMRYALAIHVPIAGMSLLPVLFGWPLVLLPVHIVFLELIIDPACSTAFEAEPEESDVMERPPRSPQARLFSQRFIRIGLLQGLGVLVMVAAVFVGALYRGQGELEARALTFTTLIIANLALIWSNRSTRRPLWSVVATKNRALWIITGGAAIFLAGALYLPPMRTLFQFSALHAADIAICLAAGIASVLWFEVMKALQRRERLQPRA
jgi:Ca2+-transporting ATPase